MGYPAGMVWSLWLTTGKLSWPVRWDTQTWTGWDWIFVQWDCTRPAPELDKSRSHVRPINHNNFDLILTDTRAHKSMLRLQYIPTYLHVRDVYCDWELQEQTRYFGSLIQQWQHVTVGAYTRLKPAKNLILLQNTNLCRKGACIRVIPLSITVALQGAIVTGTGFTGVFPMFRNKDVNDNLVTLHTPGPQVLVPVYMM